jgi:hypothetical protein
MSPVKSTTGNVGAASGGHDDVGVAVFNRVCVDEMLVALVAHEGEEQVQLFRTVRSEANVLVAAMTPPFLSLKSMVEEPRSIVESRKDNDDVGVSAAVFFTVVGDETLVEFESNVALMQLDGVALMQLDESYVASDGHGGESSVRDKRLGLLDGCGCSVLVMGKLRLSVSAAAAEGEKVVVLFCAAATCKEEDEQFNFDFFVVAAATDM